MEDVDLARNRKRAFTAAGLGWGLDGFDWTMYSFALAAMLVALGLDVAEGGYIATTALVASAVGGVLGGTLADRFGRVRVLTFVILGYALFTGLTATAQNVDQLLLWRTLHGFTFGAEWAVGAALLAEYAIPERRARTMGWLQSMYAVGWAASAGAYLLMFSLFPDDVAWRYLFLLGILPAIAAFFIRRTAKDRFEGGARRSAPLSLPMLFRAGQRRTTILATFVGFGAQAIYYSVFIFLPLYLKEERGFDVIGTVTYTWVVIAGSFTGYVLAGYVHDAIGRRRAFTLYYIGSVSSIALFVLADFGSGIGYVTGFLLGFFASGQAAGLGAYLAELFPTEMRAAGQGFAYNVGRGFAAFGPSFIGVMADGMGLGSSILIVGAVGSVVAAVCVWLLPETRGRTIDAPDSAASPARLLADAEPARTVSGSEELAPEAVASRGA